MASYNTGDQLESQGNTTYGYDANARLSEKLVVDGANSSLTTYIYDTQGNLKQVDTPEKSITYEHNALGNRVVKLVDGAIVEKYLWQDLTTLLATYNADGSLNQRFEYALGHTPVSFTQNGQSYFIQTDHLGTPRVITDSAGVVVKAMTFDSFGNIISDSNPSFEIPFGFAGGLYDKDTKLVRFGFRDYDPEIGRWTARDPIGFGGGDTNLYGYVSNNPINFVDSNGLSIMDAVFGAIYRATGERSPSQSIVDFSAGLGDALLLGFGDNLRNLLDINGGVDPCSDAYRYGGYSSFAAGIGRLAYAAIAKGGAILASSGAAASAFRARLKVLARLGIGKNWRPPNLVGKTDAGLRQSAGKTNKGLNAYGAGLVYRGINGCECE